MAGRQGMSGGDWRGPRGGTGQAGVSWVVGLGGVGVPPGRVGKSNRMDGPEKGCHHATAVPGARVIEANMASYCCSVYTSAVRLLPTLAATRRWKAAYISATFAER